MSWYQYSVDWIREKRDENPDLSREELRRYCSKHYPFAMRRGYAYKAWLKAMRDEFGDRARDKRFSAAGQDDLFSGGGS